MRIRECSYKALGVSFCISMGFVLLCEKIIDNEEAFPVETFILTTAFYVSMVFSCIIIKKEASA